MYLPKIYRDEGADGSGTGAVDAGSDPKPAKNDADPGGADKGKAKGSGESDSSDKGGEVTVESLTAKSKEQADEIARLTKKLGQSGNEKGELIKAMKRYQDDPIKAAQEILKKAGGKFKIVGSGELGDDDITKALSTDDDDVRQDALKKMSDAKFKDDITAGVFKELSPVLKTLVESNLKSRYPDYDDHGDFREEMRVLHQSGHLSTEELLHLAVRGKGLPGAVEAAKKEGRDEYIEELRKKQEAEVGAGSGKDGKASGDKDTTDVGELAEKLQEKYG